MQKFISAFLTFSAVVPMLALTWDRLVPVTQSVLNGSYVEDVARVHPYVSPNGYENNPWYVDANRRANERALRLHCSEVEDATRCGL